MFGVTPSTLSRTLEKAEVALLATLKEIPVGRTSPTTLSNPSISEGENAESLTFFVVPAGISNMSVHGG